jgi:hypothetical protein
VPPRDVITIVVAPLLLSPLSLFSSYSLDIRAIVKMINGENTVAASLMNHAENSLSLQLLMSVIISNMVTVALEVGRINRVMATKADCHVVLQTMLLKDGVLAAEKGLFWSSRAGRQNRMFFHPTSYFLL